MSEPEIDLAYIGHALARLTTEVGALRDDMNVLTAIVMRQDATLNALLNEVRAMHSQHSRLANRVRQLEDKYEGSRRLDGKTRIADDPAHDSDRPVFMRGLGSPCARRPGAGGFFFLSRLAAGRRGARRDFEPDARRRFQRAAARHEGARLR